MYVWGGGSEGQLGLGDETECPKPKLLETDDRVVCIACGYYHTALVTGEITKSMFQLRYCLCFLAVFFFFRIAP